MSSEAAPSSAAPPGREADAQVIIDAIERAELKGTLPEGANPVDHQLPMLDLPGFGDRDPDCGKCIPEARHYCDSCFDVKFFKHNCVEYDCPDHAPYAIRRRAAGSSSMPGSCAKIGALRAKLDRERPGRQYYHGLIISPPDDFYFTSTKPLKRFKQLCKEICKEFGVQGMMAYHPVRGEHEEPGEDDRGEWKGRLFQGRAWDGDVAEEVRWSPHMHIRGAGYVDVSVTEAVEEATGWVITRLWEDRDEVTDDDVAHSLPYDLSHAGIYESESGQRRLAAWLFGPDINEAKVYPDWKEKWEARVNAAGEDVLGIPAPDMECSERLEGAAVTHESAPVELSPARPSSSSSAPAGAGLGATTGSATPAASTPSTSTTVNLEGERCGGTLRHISTVDLEMLAALDLRDDVDAEDLHREYRLYIRTLERKGLDPDRDPRPTLPEEGDRPPPEPVRT